jgi:hypothetical protein
VTIRDLPEGRCCDGVVADPAPLRDVGVKAAWQVTRWIVTAAVLAAAAPVTIVAAVGYAGAWLRGWPPARLYRAALWSLPGTAVYLATAGDGWHEAASRPWRSRGRSRPAS